jgi:hypothetical protein
MRFNQLLRRLVVTSLSLVLGGGMALAVSAPASAQETLNGQCESGELCSYWLSNYNGPIADIYEDVTDFGPWHFYASDLWLNNNTYSARSAAAFWCARLYENANYGGGSLHFVPGQGRTTLGWYNDKMSSQSFPLC